MRKINKIVVHCTASQVDPTYDIERLRQIHRARGFSDVGYHFLIRTSGLIEEGRPVEVPGAHVAGHNKNSIGIALVGGIDKQGKPSDNFMSVQKQALSQLLQSLIPRFPGAEVLGHRDLSPDKDGNGVIEKHEWLKQCPCFDVRAWMLEIGLTTA